MGNGALCPFGVHQAKVPPRTLSRKPDAAIASLGVEAWHFPFLSPGTSGNFLVAIMRWENGYRGK